MNKSNQRIIDSIFEKLRNNKLRKINISRNELEDFLSYIRKND